MRKLALAVGVSLKRHILKAETLMVYMLVSVICCVVGNEMIQLSRQIQSPINALDGYIIANSNLYVFLLLTIAVMLINFDIPFMNDSQYYSIIRMGRNKWLLSRIILSAINCLLLMLFIMSCTIVFTASESYFSNNWSMATKALALGKYHIKISSAITMRLVNNYSLFQTTCLIASQAFLYWFSVSLIMMLTNICSTKKSIGFLVVLLINFGGWVARTLNLQSIYFISPLNNCILFGGESLDSGLGPMYSYVYFAVLIAGVILIARKALRRYSFQ